MVRLYVSEGESCCSRVYVSSSGYMFCSLDICLILWVYGFGGRGLFVHKVKFLDICIHQFMYLSIYVFVISCICHTYILVHYLK